MPEAVVPEAVRRAVAVFRARNREFFRDRAALMWNLAMPFLIVAGFSFAFSGGERDLHQVGVHGMDAAPALPFLELRHIRFIPIEEIAPAVQKVRRHQLDMLLDLDGAPRYWVNPDSARGYLLERLLLAGPGGPPLHKELAEGREIRYVDWVVAGVISMNMMFSALYGVGYVIVRYRKNGVLKRLRATPLTAFEFLAAQVASRLWILLATTAMVLAASRLLVGVQMIGSYLLLALVLLLGALCLIALGLALAARTASEELANGMLNLASWPMMFLSGVWFSNEGIHPWLQALAQALPLTHVIDAARAVMLEGAGLAAVAPNLLALAAITAVLMFAGTRWFRWE